MSNLCEQILSDDGKRKQYDTWGATSEQMGGGQAGPEYATHQNWNFSSSVDPEELFRKIFGQQARYSGGTYQDDFAESMFGFGASQEVIVIILFHFLSYMLKQFLIFSSP